MTNIKEFAQAYEPPQAMGNISELEVVDTNLEIHDETRKNRDGEEYQVRYIIVNGNEYRVPATVLEQIQTILKAKPDLKTVKVSRSGTGMGTKYQVIPLG